MAQFSGLVMRRFRIAGDHDHERERVGLHTKLPGAVLERRDQISLIQPTHPVIDVSGVVNLGHDKRRLEPVDIAPDADFQRVASLHSRPVVHGLGHRRVIDQIARSDREQRAADASRNVRDRPVIRSGPGRPVDTAAQPHQPLRRKHRPFPVDRLSAADPQDVPTPRLQEP